MTYYGSIRYFSLALINNCFLIAFFLGIRHGFDLDHIATIDNVTNYLARNNKPASYVGFYFSLGHSASVFLLTILTILFVQDVNFLQHIKHLSNDNLDRVISACMLTLLGSINLVSMLKNKSYATPSAITGFTAKLLSPIVKLIKKPWQTVFIGLIFGFGFDTATEIALLGITAFQAQLMHASPWNLLMLPVNFTFGMCLIDVAVSLILFKILSVTTNRKHFNRCFSLSIIGFAFSVAILQIFTAY